jgi:hypothetical protein
MPFLPVLNVGYTLGFCKTADLKLGRRNLAILPSNKQFKQARHADGTKSPAVMCKANLPVENGMEYLVTTALGEKDLLESLQVTCEGNDKVEDVQWNASGLPFEAVCQGKSAILGIRL